MAKKAKKNSPEVQEAFVTLYEQTFYSIMIGMVKAKPVEDEYAKLREAARALTEQQLRKISRLAGEYYVRNANPSFQGMTRDETGRLKKKALEFALIQTANDKAG